MYNADTEKKLYIDDYTFRVSDNAGELEKVLWAQAFKHGLFHVMEQIGWQGGTIHQLKAYILEYKKKWNNGGRLSFSKT